MASSSYTHTAANTNRQAQTSPNKQTHTHRHGSVITHTAVKTSKVVNILSKYGDDGAERSDNAAEVKRHVQVEVPLLLD